MNQYLQNIQKNTGIKQDDSKKNELYNQGLTLLKAVELHIKSIEEAKMTNEQFFLDFLDKLNLHSIQY